MDIFILFGFLLFLFGLALIPYSKFMRKIGIKYWANIILSLVCIFEIISISVSSDLYAIFVYQIITIPLGIISIIVSAWIYVKESNKTKKKTFLTSLGTILGLIVATLSIILFKIGRM